MILKLKKAHCVHLKTLMSDSLISDTVNHIKIIITIELVTKLSNYYTYNVM